VTDSTNIPQRLHEHEDGSQRNPAGALRGAVNRRQIESSDTAQMFPIDPAVRDLLPLTLALARLAVSIQVRYYENKPASTDE
jgi:hypothetical protein